MAIIQGQQQNDNNTNLNSGMNSTQPGSATPGQTMAGGAVTPAGGQASGQGGAAGSAAPKTPSSGGFTNFNNYTQNNQKAAGNLDNLLGNNFQQQGQRAQSVASNTTNAVAQGVQNSQNQISQGLNQIGQDITSGNFNNALQAGVYNAPQTNTQSTAGINTTQANNVPQGTTSPSTATTTNTATANTPAQYQTAAYQPLQTWAQNLATGNAGQTALQTQANTGFQAAQNVAQNMTTQQGLLQNSSGVGTLLNTLLGSNGKYSQGSNALDQALVTGNSGNYTNLLNNVGNQVNTTNQAITSGQTAANTGITNLTNAATAAQQQLQGSTGPYSLSNALGNLNTNLSSTASAAEQQRQAQQLAMLNEFNTNSFDAATAAQLGIQNGTTLFNTLTQNGQNYNITDPTKLSQYQNSPYLDLNQQQVNASNVINNQQLGAYSAMQQLLGNNNQSNWAYTQAGTVDPAYTLNSGAFDKALAQQYQNAINSAQNTTLSGHGSQDYSYGLFGSQHGTATADVSDAVSNLVNIGNLQQAAQTFGAMGSPQQQATGAISANGVPSNALNNEILGVAQQGLNPIAPQLGALNALNDVMGPGAIGTIENAVTQVAPMATQNIQTALSNPVSALNPIASVGAANALTAANSIGSLLNSAGINPGGLYHDTSGSSQADANAQALANLQSNWQNYQNQMGYQNVANIVNTPAALASNVSDLLNTVSAQGV